MRKVTWLVSQVMLIVIASSGLLMAGELDWLAGTWRRETAKSIRYESWTRLSGQTLEGSTRQVVRETGVSSWVESLLVAEMAGETFYIAKVAENPRPIAFKLTSRADGNYRFENPEHDFPQVITYHRGDGATLRVVIGNLPGPDGAAGKQIEYVFTREPAVADVQK